MNILFNGKHALGECVLWCDRTQRLWWTDILGKALWSIKDGVTSNWPMPERLASFALTNDENILLLGLESKLAFFNIADNRISKICEVEVEIRQTRINDGRCDREGRFVFGTMNEDPKRDQIGSFYRLNHDLSLERLDLPNVAIANGICFSPDGSKMYFCDSLEHKVQVCHYGESISNIKDFVNVEGEPDGSTVDADGCLWIACWGASVVLQITPDGAIHKKLEMPVSQPTCVAFGGANLDRLYVTTAKVGLSDELLASERLAGAVFEQHVPGTQGLLEARFQGVCSS